jgi:D-alanyl-D-alanine dipeptidase
MEKSKIIVFITLFIIVALCVFYGIKLYNKNKPQSQDSSNNTSDQNSISNSSNQDSQNDNSDFVLVSEYVPDAILEIRYYSTYNFVGDRINGYEEPVALLTKDAAIALKAVSDDLKAKGYRLKIYDAYRPQKAVTHFMNWAKDLNDARMKEYFYPDLDKSVLFDQGYIAEKSGHSRGSTVDLTLFDMNTEKELDMGGTFDYFGELSHPIPQMRAHHLARPLFSRPCDQQDACTGIRLGQAL